MSVDPSIFAEFRRPPLHIVTDADARRRRLEQALDELDHAIPILEQRQGAEAARTADTLRALRRDLLAALRLNEE